MSERRTITVGQGIGDSLAAAQRVADALRQEGKTVTIGDEYDNVTTTKYGLRSVDIVIEDAPVTEAVSADEPVVPAAGSEDTGNTSAEPAFATSSDIEVTQTGADVLVVAFDPESVIITEPLAEETPAEAVEPTAEETVPVESPTYVTEEPASETETGA